MSFQEILNSAIGDSKSSLGLFLPELVLCGTILLMLALRVFKGLDKIPSWLVDLAGSGLALWFAQPWSLLAKSVERTEIFHGLLVIDGLTVFIRGLLLCFVILFILLTRLTKLVNPEDDADISTLVIGAVLGMCLMAEANHLLMVFMAIEMASVPSYVMAGMLRNNKKSSEAALKYAIYGAGTAGVMLYGISLLAGSFGTCHLPTITKLLTDPAVTAQLPMMPMALGGLMLAVGLAFKLSAVPFHFWCPDVFEGAPAEVNGFLSVASKAAALALLIRVVIGFSGGADEPAPVVQAAPQQLQVKTVSDNDHGHGDEHAHGVTQHEHDAVEHEAHAEESTGISPKSSRNFLVLLIGIVSAITCTFGNLAAYGQTNIKRLLAYSTIAHAGYMMMPVAAAMALMNTGSTGTVTANEALAAVLLYASIYLFMNLGAFAIIALLRNRIGSEEIADYAGLVRSSPGIVICFSMILFSLIGLPPLAGFLGKLNIFMALVEADLLLLLVIAGLNTAVCLVFYLRVIKTMTIDAPREDRGPVHFPMLSIPGIYVALVTVPVLFIFPQWNDVVEMTQTACKHLIQ